MVMENCPHPQCAAQQEEDALPEEAAALRHLQVEHGRTVPYPDGDETPYGMSKPDWPPVSGTVRTGIQHMHPDARLIVIEPLNDGSRYCTYASPANDPTR